METTGDLLPGPHALGKSLGRLARRAVVHCDGPLVLSVLFGTPQGRWHAEFTSTARAARDATRLLCVANGVSVLSDATVDAPVTLGMAVTLSWRFVYGAPRHEQTCAMMHAAQAAHPRRQGMIILEHPVLHSMPWLMHADPPALPEHWAHMSANSLGRVLLQDLARVTNGESHRVLRQWEASYGPLADVVVAWLAWAPLARALAQREWHADVTPRFRRCDTGESWAALVMPSARLVFFFANTSCEDTSVSDGDLPDTALDHGSRLALIPIQRVMDGLRLGSVLRSQRLGEVALGAASAIVPRSAAPAAPALVRTMTLPSRATLQRARVRLEVGARLCHRWLWTRERRPSIRYLAYDASPQRGVEIFATVERVLTVLSNDGRGPVSAVHERRLPLVTLGHRRTTLEDKVQAHVRQTWLEYGPRADTLLRANVVVRQCLSDMGTEVGLADVSDVAHACIRSGQRGRCGPWLYPFALQAPGTQHLLGAILQDSLDCVSWWHAWEEQAKVVCQWVHPRARRAWLQSCLQGRCAGLAQSLDAGCESFAVWRWKMRSNVTRDLLRTKDALQHATAGQRACDLGSRDSVLAQTFLTVVQSDVFWSQCHALQALARPVPRFSGWLRAVFATKHEADCLAQRQICCT